MRTAEKTRVSAETEICLSLNLEGSGTFSGSSGIPFFDHMLTLFAKHGLMDLNLHCAGDVEVDDHHSIEDIGIVLGQAFAHALGNKAGICRYATVFLPMDEALVMVSLDLSGRPFLAYDVAFSTPTTGQFDACLMEEFLRAFAFAAGITLHVKMLSGKNTHHILEAIMKGLARALDQAMALDERVTGVPSTKGLL